jgi:hypothetical protein
MSKHRITITISVKYDEATIRDVDQLISNVESNIDRAIQDGMLSGSDEEIIEEFEVCVE